MQRAAKLAAFTVVFMAATAVHAQQAEGNLMVRARAVNLDFANKSDPIPSLGVPADAITVNNKAIPEIDITYFLSKNWAAELILTVPQKQSVRVKDSVIGAFDAGTFKHLPPTLLLQYHFNPEGDFRPYVGAGINYTLISSEKLQVPGVTGLHLNNDSWGGAIQAGFDVKLSKNVFLNVDIKKVQIRSDLKNDAGAKVSYLKLDPVLTGIGIGYRF